MSMFTLPFENIGLSTINIEKTAASLQTANTAGHRCRVRSLSVGGGDNLDPHVDAPIRVRLLYLSGLAGGAGGTGTSVTPSKKDQDSLASIVTCKRNFTAEPTYDSTEPVFQFGFNYRGAFIKEWQKEDAPIVSRDALLGLVFLIKGALGRVISGCLEFEEF